MRRKKARRKRKEKIQNILEAGRGPKSINKNGPKKKISCMYKSNGEPTTFYQQLYKKSITNHETTQIEPSSIEIDPFTPQEVSNVMKKMKKNKAPGNDNLTTDIIELGGKETLENLTEAFNNILTSQIIPETWKEAKVIILFKKGDGKDYRPISLLAHTYKLFTRLLQSRIEDILDNNQPREQAVFRKYYSTRDHLQALNQVIEKCNEYNKTLCVGFVDYLRHLTL